MLAVITPTRLYKSLVVNAKIIRNLSTYKDDSIHAKELSSAESNCSNNNQDEKQILQSYKFPIELIRNFSIVAHVDHGKSTLADRLLELCGAIPIDLKHNKQILDSLQVERERGITVKAQTVTLNFKNSLDQKLYQLNLIDTPGHVDFSNEVYRSLAICDGVILLIDACHGVQAQTVSNYHIAQSKNLKIVPILNKIDIKHSKPDIVCKDLKSLFQIDPERVLRISAKNGLGIENVLQQVVKEIPPPINCNRSNKFQAIIFDSWYDRYRGALNLVLIQNGTLTVGQEIQSHLTGKTYQIKTISILRPSEEYVENLYAGQVGLIGCNMRNSTESIIGDIIYLKDDHKEFNTINLKSNLINVQKPMVYAGIYPKDKSKHVQLRLALDKLKLNDSAVTFRVDSNPALGQGWRLGFLGLLHMEVFCQRLEQEYLCDTIITSPSVTYRMKLKNTKLIRQNNGNPIIEISNPLLLPDPKDIDEYYEPFVKGTIITPTEYMGKILTLCIERRGVQENAVNIDDDRLLLTFILPLSEIIIDFNDKLKSLSSGYASFNYDDYGFHKTNLIRLDVVLNGKLIEEFSHIVNVSKAQQFGRSMVEKLKEEIPKQMIQIAIQSVCGSKVIARETIKAYRKDVTSKLYGGDVTRRKKLLAQQAEGKKKMRMIGNIRIPNETFLNVLKR